MNPIIVYAVNDPECRSFAVHPACTQENLDRFKEKSIDQSRIHVITDNSQLLKMIEAIKSKATLIIPGGNTSNLFFATKEKDTARFIKTAALAGKLDIWGQCSGANFLCKSIDGFSIPTLNLIPFISNPEIYPSKEPRVATIHSGSKSFVSYWNAGSSLEEQWGYDYGLSSIEELAHYHINNQKHVAAVSCTTWLGATYVASCPHLEVVNFEVPGTDGAPKQFAADKVRDELMMDIWKRIGICQQSQN